MDVRLVHDFCFYQKSIFLYAKNMIKIIEENDCDGMQLAMFIELMLSFLLRLYVLLITR